MTTVELCAFAGISQATLRTWIKWAEDTDIPHPPLPTPKTDGSRYEWDRSDVDKLILFKTWMPRGRNGVMGRLNEIHWPKYKRQGSVEDGIE